MDREPSLRRLVYHSKNAIEGTDAEIEAEIGRVLAAARRNNPKSNVTGALMFNRACFAQVLEGPEREVAEVFERIQRDPRHADVSLICHDGIEARGFPNWSMAFVSVEEGSAAYRAIAAKSGFDADALRGERLLEVLSELVIEEEQLAAT